MEPVGYEYRICSEICILRYFTIHEIWAWTGFAEDKIEKLAEELLRGKLLTSEVLPDGGKRYRASAEQVVAIYQKMGRLMKTASLQIELPAT